MIRQHREFKSGSFFYAINFDGLTVSTNILRAVSVPAIWFKRRQGNLTAVKGYLFHYAAEFRDVDPSVEIPVPDLIEGMKANMRSSHGGVAEFRWDGQSMWAPQKTFAETTAVQNELAEHLQNFPQIPLGYTGWYSLKGN